MVKLIFMVFRLESKTVVRNTDYFRAVESDLRTAMKRFETMLLPIAEQAARDACVKVKEHPKEGYYTETTSLSRYFDILRSLQENFSPIITDSIRLLHEIYSHRVFGLGKAVRTAISDEALFPAESPAIISPVADPVSMASAKVQPNWTIDGIMDALVGIKLGTCLVGLAILVDSKENIQVSEQRRYNPLATCMACETTVLSRHKSTWRGGGSSKSQVDWQVDRAVEEYGNALIAAYNDLFTKGGSHFLLALEMSPRIIFFLS